MKARTKFMEMFGNMSEKAGLNLVYCPYGDHPMSLNVIVMEIKNNTQIGKRILKEIGFEDDK